MKNMKLWIGIASVLILVLMLVFPVSILAFPEMTPLEYLSSIPSITIASIVLITPSSTFFVYLLGVIILYFGIRLYQQKNSLAKYYWGLSLILWGVGTLLAGTSYQGLGYELKCSGQELCLFTSWFELAYLFVTSFSILVMAFAVSEIALKDSAKVLYRKIVSIGYLVYLVTFMIGILFEIYFLITYEYFLLCFLPYFVSFLVMNIKGYQKDKNILDKRLIIVWFLMLLVNILYFAYFFSGIPEFLYENYNIWFSANDVLHIGLIGWMYYIYRTVK